MQTDFKDLTLPDEVKPYPTLTYFKIVTIPILVYIVALLGYFKVINFNISLHTVIMMGIILVVALIFARHSGELAYKLLVSNTSHFKSSLKDYILNSLVEIGAEKKSSESFDDFFHKYSINFRNDNLANSGAAIFPMLGILGTFISIAISMPSFSTNDSNALQSDISSLLSGVGTAFYVSIYGIFLSIWWIFLEKCAMSKIERFASEQKDISKQFFWQKSEFEKVFIAKSVGYFDDVRTLFAKVSSEKFFNELDGVIDEKFKALKSLQSAEEQMLLASKIALEQNIKLLDKTSLKQHEFIKSHAEILNAISSLNSTFKELELRFSTQYNRLDEIMGKQSNSLQTSIEKFDLSLIRLKSSLAGFSTRLIEEQKISMQGFRDSILEGVEAFKTAYELEDKQTQLEQDKLLGDLKNDADVLSKQVDEVLQNLKQTNDEIKK